MQTLLVITSVLLHFLSYGTFKRIGAALPIKEKEQGIFKGIKFGRKKNAQH